MYVCIYYHESVKYHLVNYKWLNIYQRSTFRYLKLIFNILKNRLPSYLNDLLQFRVYKRVLRNYSTRLSLNRKYKLSIYGKRFQCSCSDLWNALPVPLITNVKSLFKSNINSKKNNLIIFK